MELIENSNESWNSWNHLCKRPNQLCFILFEKLHRLGRPPCTAAAGRLAGLGRPHGAHRWSPWAPWAPMGPHGSHGPPWAPIGHECLCFDILSAGLRRVRDTHMYGNNPAYMSNVGFSHYVHIVAILFVKAGPTTTITSPRLLPQEAHTMWSYTMWRNTVDGIS